MFDVKFNVVITKYNFNLNALLHSEAAVESELGSGSDSVLKTDSDEDFD